MNINSNLQIIKDFQKYKILSINNTDYYLTYNNILTYNDIHCIYFYKKIWNSFKIFYNIKKS